MCIIKKAQGICLFSTTRIDLLLKNRSVGTHKFIKELIRQQRVFDQHKNLILSASTKVLSDADVYIDKQVIPHPLLLAVCHKPVGVLSTLGEDPLGRPNLTHLLSLSQHAALQDMHPVGRLDSDTSGLLLFSSHGGLTNVLLQPQSGITRVYEAVVTGLVDFDQLKEVLGKGVTTTDGVFPACLLACTHVQYDVRMADSFKTPKDFDVTLGKLLAQSDLSENILSRVRVSVTEGKHRMVRRVLHNAGHSVVQLKRVEYGAVSLDKLEVGCCVVASSAVQKWALQLLSSSGNSGKKKKNQKKHTKKER